MATGKTTKGKSHFPSIEEAHELSLRAVNLIVRNVRERIQAIESVLDQTTATSQQSAFSLQQQISTISQTGGGTQGGPTTTQYTSGTVLTLPCAVFLSSKTGVSPSDPTLPGASFGCFGVAISQTASNVQVAAAGQVIAVSGMVPFQPVFSAANGQLTQTPPAAPAVIQVGVAISATLMLVAPSATAIDGTSITGIAAIDNALPATNVIWQFNGVQVSARRIVDVVAAAGFTMAVQDDPGGNRVIITFGASVSPFAAQLVEDAWDWQADDQLIDEWESWADDSVANSATFTPSAVLSLEDPWLEWDDLSDDWELWGSSEVEASLRGVGSAFLNLEDAWPWEQEVEFFDEWDLAQDDSQANSSTGAAPSAVLSLEDAWPWDDAEIEDEAWTFNYDEPNRSPGPPPPPPPPPPAPTQPPEDGWPWGNPDGVVDDEWESWQFDSAGVAVALASFTIAGVSTNTSTSSISVPAGAAVGDLLVLVVTNGSANAALPAAFASSFSGLYGAVGTRTMQSGDSSFSLPQTDYATLVAIHKTAGGTPVVDKSTITGPVTSTQTMSTTAATPSTATDGALMIFVNSDGANQAPQPGFNNLITYNLSGVGVCGMSVSWTVLSSSSSFGGTNCTVSATTGFPGAAIMLLFD